MKEKIKRITRNNIANPFLNINLEEKRNKAKSINLKDNYLIENLDNGYSKIIPIDTNKRFK